MAFHNSHSQMRRMQADSFFVSSECVKSFKKTSPENVTSSRPVAFFESLDIYQEEECDADPRVLRTVIETNCSSSLACIEPYEEAAITFNDALHKHELCHIEQASKQYQLALLSAQSLMASEIGSHLSFLPLLQISMRAYNNMGCIEYSRGMEASARLKFQAALMFGKQMSDLNVCYRLEYATILSNCCRLRWISEDISDTLYISLLEVHRLRASVLPWHHPDMAAALYNLAMADYSNQKQQEASIKLKQFLNIWSHRSANGLRDIDPVPALIILLLIQNEDCEDDVSEELVRGLRTLQDKRQFQGPMCSEVASVLNCIGTLLFHKKDFENSLVFFEEELRLEEALVNNKSDISVSVTCNNIGRILQELGRFHEAVHYYERALDKDPHDDNELGPFSSTDCQGARNHTAVAPALNLYSTAWYNLGLIQDKLGAYRDAITSFKMSLGLRKTLMGAEHPDIACLHYNIGVLEMEQDLLDDASESFHAALHVRSFAATVHLGDFHVIKTLGKLSSLHQSKGNIKRALESTQDVLRIQRASRDFDEFQRPIEISLTLQSMAELHRAVGDLSNATAFAFESVRTLEKAKHTAPPELNSRFSNNSVYTEQMVSSMLLLGSIYHEQSEPILAKSVFAQTMREISKANCTLSVGLATLREITFLLVSSNCAPQA